MLHKPLKQQLSSQGYSRKGAALTYLGRLTEAVAAYEKGLQLDPNNQQLKDGLAECRAKVRGQITSQYMCLAFTFKLSTPLNYYYYYMLIYVCI